MTDAQLLGKADRHCVIAPAGFGKTYLIAETVASHCGGRQLLLTHTHAGVRAMRTRLAAMGCPPSRYRVETISGWALRYAASFPELSGVSQLQPTGGQWKEIYQGASALFDSKAIRRVLQISYAGMFVDEYQDCTKSQHQLVTRLADLIPCRLLGDPLQGIFDFEHDRLDWTTDIYGQFEKLPPLRTAHRWSGRNEALGAWLSDVRCRLETGSEIDLTLMPRGAEWRACDHPTQLQVCYSSLVSGHTVAAIHEGTLESPCHKLARGLGGHFQCMEAVDCKALYEWAGRIEREIGGMRASLLIDFASECLTKVGTELRTIKKHLLHDPARRGSRIRKHVELLHLLEAVEASASLAPAAMALEGIRQLNGAVMFRRELWESFRRSLREFLGGDYPSLADAAWVVRDRVRRNGRPAEPRTVSRTLLVKGLEYDHAIVLDADKLDTKQLYVALSRGSRRLTVLSREPVLRPS